MSQPSTLCSIKSRGLNARASEVDGHPALIADDVATISDDHTYRLGIRSDGEFVRNGTLCPFASL
jgi:hypothetical protein